MVRLRIFYKLNLCASIEAQGLNFIKEVRTMTKEKLKHQLRSASRIEDAEKLLNAFDYDYDTFTSPSGRRLIEVYELLFVFETNDGFETVGI